MQKRFDSIVTQLDGTPWKNEHGEPLTVGKAVTTALLAAYDDDRTLSGEEKFKRFLLAERIHGAGTGTVEVTAENLSLIKLVVARAFTTGVVGFIYRYLESDPGPP